MTASDEEQFEKDAAERYGRMIGADGPVLGVLTGQVPITMHKPPRQELDGEMLEDDEMDGRGSE